MLRIESSAFVHNGKIPMRYTCNGEGEQIPLNFFGVPESAKSLVLIVDDPDAPNGDFVHWLLWNINPATFLIDVNNFPEGAIEGFTSLGKPGWVAPCPPSGVHHYNFKVMAIDETLSLPPTSTKSDILREIKDHVIESATIVGLYEQKK